MPGLSQLTPGKFQQLFLNIETDDTYGCSHCSLAYSNGVPVITSTWPSTSHSSVNCQPALPLNLLLLDLSELSPKRVANEETREAIQELQTLTAQLSSGSNPLAFHSSDDDDEDETNIVPVQNKEELKRAIDEQKQIILDRSHIIAPVIGHGVTENHIVTAYRPPQIGEHSHRWQLYDSKVGDSSQFISQKFSLPTRLWHIIKGPFRALFNLHYSETNVPYHGNADYNLFAKGVDYFSLGRQSFYDGVKCGYDTLDVVRALQNYLTPDSDSDDDIEYDNDKIIIPSLDGLQQELALNADQYNTAESANADSLSLKHFIHYAWRNTFVPDNDKNKNFAHYFLGWPKQKSTLAISAYFLTLGFILNPIINACKIPTEFVVKAIAETFNWMRNNLMAWAPRNVGLQYLRSGALLLVSTAYALTEGLRLLIRTIISPINSFKAAMHTYRNSSSRLAILLPIASATLSIVLISALVIFAGPALLAIAPSVSTTLAALTTKLVSTIGLPIANFVFGTATAAPAIAAAITSAIIGAGVTLLRGINGLIKHRINKRDSRNNHYQQGDLLHSDDGDILGFDLYSIYESEPAAAARRSSEARVSTSDNSDSDSSRSEAGLDDDDSSSESTPQPSRLRVPEDLKLKPGETGSLAEAMAKHGAFATSPHPSPRAASTLAHERSGTGCHN